jgi:pimeloyl-ACP methyl ester carboxylesterase
MEKQPRGSRFFWRRSDATVIRWVSLLSLVSLLVCATNAKDVLIRFADDAKDGVGREDWHSRPYVVLNCNSEDEGNQSACLYRWWTSKGLFLAFDVHDNVFAVPRTRLFCGDGVDIFLDLRPKDQRGRSPYAAGVFHLRVQPYQGNVDRPPVLSLGTGSILALEQLRRIETALKVSGNNWQLEVCIPWEILGFDPNCNEAIGFGICVLDSDNPRLPGFPQLGVMAVNASTKPETDPVTFDTLYLQTKSVTPSGFSISAHEVVMNGNDRVYFSMIAPSEQEVPKDAVLHVGSTGAEELAIPIVFHHSFGGHFWFFEDYISLDSFAPYDHPIELRITRGGDKDSIWKDTVGIPIARKRRQIETALPECELQKLNDPNRLLATYYKEMALDVTEQMTLKPDPDRARQRQLRVRENPAYFDTMIDYFLGLAKRMAASPNDDFLTRYHQVWQSPTDGSLQLFKVELPMNFQPERRYPMDINFHPLLWPGERFRWMTDLLKLDFDVFPIFSGRCIRIDLFGKGNSFEFMGDEEFELAYAWALQHLPVDRRQVTFSGISDGATYAMDFATRYPDKVTLLDLRSGSYLSRFIDETVNLTERPVLENLYDVKVRTASLGHIQVRLASGKKDPTYNQAMFAMASRLQDAGVNTENVIACRSTAPSVSASRGGLRPVGIPTIL